MNHTTLTALLAEQLKEHHNASRWILAYSGGGDSSALLHLLAQYRDQHADVPPITALHINHQLQVEAAQWVTHCERECAALDIALYVHEATVDRDRASEEAAAREARYACFEQVLQAGDVLLMAHHLDDQVETFFLRLMRGAGAEGLRGMPAVRALGRGLLFRPLLAVPRAVLSDYVDAHQFAVIHDPTNISDRYDRSYLRRQVLPLLAQRWPGYRNTVERAMGHLQRAVVEGQSGAGRLEACCSVLGDSGLSLQGVDQLSAQALTDELRHWLKRYRLSMPTTAALTEFVRQLQTADDHQARLTSAHWQLQYFANAVYLLPPEGDEQGGAHRAELVLCAPGETGVLAKPETLAIRYRQGGERCKPQGQVMHKSLKKLLQQWQIPPWWRDRLPLLYHNDSLLGIADLHWCDSALVAPTETGERRWRLQWRRSQFPHTD